MDRTIHRNNACTQPAFSGHRTQLAGKPSAPFEKALNTGLEMKLRFYIWYFGFVHDSCR